MTLPDENRLVRRDLRGFRTDATNQNLNPSYFTSSVAGVANATPAASGGLLNRSKTSGNLISPIIRASDASSNGSTPEMAAATATEAASRPTPNYLNQASALRRSSGPGLRSSRPIPSASLSETLQVRMATNAMAAAARARNISPRTGRPKDLY